MGIKLNISKQCEAAVAKEGNRMLGCNNNSITRRDKKVIIPLSACQAVCEISCSVLLPAIKQVKTG